MIYLRCTGRPRLSVVAADPRTSFHTQEVSGGVFSSASSFLAPDGPGWKMLPEKNSPLPHLGAFYIHFSHSIWCSVTAGNSYLCPSQLRATLFLPTTLLKALLFTLYHLTAVRVIPRRSGASLQALEMRGFPPLWRDDLKLSGALTTKLRTSAAFKNAWSWAFGFWLPLVPRGPRSAPPWPSPHPACPGGATQKDLSCKLAHLSP